jgi:putative spermidine/putrescine transport system permease protein
MTSGREDPVYDRTVLLVVPGVLLVMLLFVYPFLYGFVLSFEPREGGWLQNYFKFFTTPYLYNTIATTLWLAVPATLVNVGLSLPIAFKMRQPSRYQRILTTILVVPITLGTVLVAEGLLGYLGPQGWLSRLLMETGIVSSPIRLTHNYWGVFLSLVITGFPFAFLLILSYITGIDPALPQAAATLGAGPSRRFLHIYLPLLAPRLAIAF